MAKFIYIYYKNKHEWLQEVPVIEKVLNGGFQQPYLHQSTRELLWVSHQKGLKIHNFSLTTGSFSDDKEQFTFSLKISKEEILLKSDLVASRTIWHYSDEEKIIVSSSQRAMIAIIGNFEYNPQAASWMLCTGSLGPENSWDRRIKAIKPAHKITINKKTFLSVTELDQPPINNELTLSNIFDSVFSSFQSTQNTAITLSGGWDSRACAYHLKKYQHTVPAYTWGTESSLSNPQTDAGVAHKVAQKLELPFRFKSLKSENSPENLLLGFVQKSEGRIDHINSFMDGFQFWEGLQKEGVTQVIRADEAFGWLRVSSEQNTRISLDINFPEDYENIKKCFEIGKLESPIWPDDFLKNHSESMSSWRDRLYRNFRLPYILSALQEVMLQYVEILNPLLHSDFVHWAEKQNDQDRTEKSLYKKFAKNLLPEISNATIPSIPEVDQVVSAPEVLQTMLATVNTQKGLDVLGKEFVAFLTDGAKKQAADRLENQLLRTIKNNIPFFMKKILRKSLAPYQIGHNRLILRAYIIIAMLNTIEADLKK